MRIALVTDVWDADRGGMERYLDNLSRYLQEAGHTIEVYCRESRDTVSPWVHRVPAFPFPRALRDWSFHQNLGTALAPCETVLAVRPTTAATHYQLHTGVYRDTFEAERDALDSVLRRQLYRPASYVNPRRRLLLAAQNRLLKDRAGVRLMTVSRKVCRQLERTFGIDSSQVAVCPPGVDLERFSVPIEERGEPGGALNLLFVAHNFVLKGLHCLFEALARAEARSVGARLWVVGRGPIARFQRLTQRHGIAGRVTFVGGVSQEQLAQMYRAAHALVHPTFYDACSLVTLEALACGCPVITTRRNGASEVMEGGNPGILIDDPRDVEGLAKALGSMRDTGRLEQMRRAALAIRDRLSFAAHASSVMGWLQTPAMRERSIGCPGTVAVP